ncbi:MAG: hypothetical protein ACYDHU_11690 [Acidimicrobiales bacterium]
MQPLFPARIGWRWEYLRTPHRFVPVSQRVMFHGSASPCGQASHLLRHPTGFPVMGHRVLLDLPGRESLGWWG